MSGSKALIGMPIGDLRAFGEFQVAFDSAMEFSLPTQLLFKSPDPNGTSHDSVMTNVLLEQLCGDGAGVSREANTDGRIHKRLLPYALSAKGTRWPVVHLPITARTEVAIHQYSQIGHQGQGGSLTTSLQGQLFYQELSKALISLESTDDRSRERCGLSCMYRFLFSGIGATDERQRLASLISSTSGGTSTASLETILEVTPEKLIFTLGEVAKLYGINTSSNRPKKSSVIPTKHDGDGHNERKTMSHDTNSNDSNSGDASCLVGWFSKEAVYFLAWQRACQLLKEASLEQELFDISDYSNRTISDNECECEEEKERSKKHRREKVAENGLNNHINNNDVAEMDDLSTRSPFATSTEPIMLSSSFTGQLNALTRTMLHRRHCQRLSSSVDCNEKRAGQSTAPSHLSCPTYQYSQGCQTAICVPGVNTTSPFVSQTIVTNSQTIHTDIGLSEYLRSLVHDNGEGQSATRVVDNDLPSLTSVCLSPIEMLVWSVERGLIEASPVIHNVDGSIDGTLTPDHGGHIMMKKRMPYGIITLGNGAVLNNKILHFVDVCPLTAYPDTIPPILLRVIVDDKSPSGCDGSSSTATIPSNQCDKSHIPRIRVMGAGGSSGPVVGSRWSLCEPMDVSCHVTVRIGTDLAISFREYREKKEVE